MPNLPTRIRSHLRTLPHHAKRRKTAVLLQEALDELDELETELTNLEAAHADELRDVEERAKDIGFEAGKKGDWM